MKQDIKASIVILDFLKSKRVCQNVKSILAQKVNFNVEVIVVDNSCNETNASKLLELKKFPNVHVQINKENVGYVRGNNQGAHRANGEYILIVNPDIVWRKNDTLQKLVDYMDNNSKVGIAGPKQINDDDGSVAMTVRAFPKLFLQVARRTFLRKLPIMKNKVAYDEMQHLDYDKEQEVDWLQSSFWIVRADLWKKWGGLNKNYFLFMSDPDLCFRAWEEGYKVMYYPKAVVYADGIRLSHGGLKDFFRKWTMRQHLKDSIKYRKLHAFKGNPRKKKART